MFYFYWCGSLQALSAIYIRSAACSEGILLFKKTAASRLNIFAYPYYMFARVINSSPTPCVPNITIRYRPNLFSKGSKSSSSKYISGESFACSKSRNSTKLRHGFIKFYEFINVFDRNKGVLSSFRLLL